MNVTIIGAGYVGLSTAIALAYIGHDVIAVDKDQQKLAMLTSGQSPIYESGINELLEQLTPHLQFTDQSQEAIASAEVIFITVGTPQLQNGSVDLRYFEVATDEIAAGIQPGQACTIVVKSTVPIGTNRWIAHRVENILLHRGITARVTFAANPEFLREGVALFDTLYPDRIVIGSDQPEAISLLKRLYRPIFAQDFPLPDFLSRQENHGKPQLVITDVTSAEMIKYAANAFLPLKISFINEIAGLCERVGADVTEVARGIGSDTRIGTSFLNAGLGWGEVVSRKIPRRSSTSLPPTNIRCRYSRPRRKLINASVV